MLKEEKGLLIFECKTKCRNPNYGKSIVAFPEDYTVIDLETTGLDPERELIIEFAAIKVRNCIVADTFQSLCYPGFPIPPVIENLTGITTEMVRFCPNPRSVLPHFLDFVGDDYILGHNVLFDIRFIAKSAGIFNNCHIDTMKLFRKLHPELSHHRLSDMVSFYKKHNDSAHRALSDCYATQACFEEMKKEVRNKFETDEKFLKNFK